MLLERGEREPAENVCCQPLLSVLVLQSLLPISGSELEDAAAGPAGQQAQKIAQVAPRLDLVELAAREQGHEGRVDGAAVLAADEEPVFAADRLPPQLALAPIIVDGQSSVLEKSCERLALIARVADPFGDRCFVQHVRCLRLAPCEKSLDHRLGLRPPNRESVVGGRAGQSALDAEQATDERERLAGAVRVGTERLEEVAPGVTPAADLDDVAAPIEMIEHGMCIGDQIPAIVTEQTLGRIRIVFGRKREQDMLFGRDYPEMPVAAAFGGLHQDAGGIGQKVGCRE